MGLLSYSSAFHLKVIVLKQQHPNALVTIHPECTGEMRKIADYIGSTSKMCRYIKESNHKEFIIGTEEGLLHRLRTENPEKHSTTHTMALFVQT